MQKIAPTRFVGLHAHSGFSTFDGLGRDFSVDLSGLVTNVTGTNRSTPVSSVADIWSANLIHGQATNGTLSTISNQHEWFNSIRNVGLGDTSNWHYRVGTGTLRNNPWLSLSGVFGDVIETRVSDLSLVKKSDPDLYVTKKTISSVAQWLTA